ncbi:MAG TPA: squalene synthase HpnC [Micromonosporaceae bacterium]|nr:squalene synthase HpnC [Micromonosporaceae bacterium]
MGSVRAGSGGSSAEAGWTDRVGGRSDGYLRRRESTENFPVALRVLPADVRPHLEAVYDVARVIDDLGDEAPGDRVELLTDFRDDLDAIWTIGPEPASPVLRRLADTVRAKNLSRRPFDDLIEANLVDQEVMSYPTYADLVEYCELSANPVGRIVLEVFGVSTPERVELSDRVCTALQIIEHCQDVGEDRRTGRIYLPLEDLDKFGVVPTDLDASQASEDVRRLIAFEANRARALLNSGTPLLGQLRGWARLAVTGYVAGGGAALLALRRARWDVLAGIPRARKVDMVRQLAAVTRGRRAGW